MTTKLVLLNYLLFFCTLVGLFFNSNHFLLYMVSLEFMYLSVVCGFSGVSVFLGFGEGIVFALFCLGLAAIEAVIGFFFFSRRF